MFSFRKSSVLVLLILAGTSSAMAQTTNRTFQGTSFVIAAPSACSAANTDVGSYHTIIYRQKVASTDNPDAMSFHTERSAFRIMSSSAAGSLATATPTTNGYLNSRSNSASGLTGQANLAITSSGGAALTVANSLKFVGTVNSFFGVAGCDITIRATGVLRPD
jgi:hypothetical protein